MNMCVVSAAEFSVFSFKKCFKEWLLRMNTLNP